MRIALISDIHANCLSLDAVLADIERQKVDRIICLGDVATLGPQPREVVSRLEELGCSCIRGNHDDYVLDPQSVPNLAWIPSWYADQLGKDDHEFLRSFEPSMELTLDAGRTLLCFHGSPSDNTRNILATTPSDELDEILDGFSATVLAGGHTHVQMMRQHRGTLVVNAGSVGQPFVLAVPQGEPRYLPWAEYAIVDQSAERLNVDLRRVPVDVEALKRIALASDMPDSPAWVRLWT